jgi:hypothetical protein
MESQTKSFGQDALNLAHKTKQTIEKTNITEKAKEYLRTNIGMSQNLERCQTGFKKYDR